MLERYDHNIYKGRYRKKCYQNWDGMDEESAYKILCFVWYETDIHLTSQTDVSGLVVYCLSITFQDSGCHVSQYADNDQ